MTLGRKKWFLTPDRKSQRLKKKVSFRINGLKKQVTKAKEGCLELKRKREARKRASGRGKMLACSRESRLWEFWSSFLHMLNLQTC